MTPLDSRKVEEGQIGQPARLGINVLSTTGAESRNGTKVSDVSLTSDTSLARASVNGLPFLKRQNAIDGGVIQGEGSSRCFSLSEVLIATENFDDALVIGVGGFGKVYKGFIDNGDTVVAIKRLNAESKQGAREFWTEVKMLSKLRHAHLVSLIGYCEDGQEMILVYEYISRGTLADHLYKHDSTKNKTSISPLPWEQRLYVCIGAARGLDYLHSGTDQSFIHRDVKSTNILLDQNWASKISDFGLSKGTSHSITHVSTDVRGTFGYLDPDYFITQRLTTKSDVYAFGVVLLEVLCGRQPVDRKLGEEQISLVQWAQQCIKKGKLDLVIDPSLSGQIAPRCLKSFVVVANNCLRKVSKLRPTMAEVLGTLELALLSQQRGKTEGIIIKAFQSMGWLRERKDISSSSAQPNDSLLERKDISSSSEKPKESTHESNSNIASALYRHFSLVDIREATEDFNTSLLVRNSDKVYKGSVKIDGKALTVAIKRFKKLKAVEAEIHPKTLLLHPHILPLIGFCTEGDELIYVYDYMSNGSLRDHLHHLDTPLPWKTRLQICIGAALGIEYLQADAESQVICYRIEPSNILLDGNWVAKVMIPNTRTSNSSEAGIIRSTTTRFDALDQEEDDIYSFGVMLLEVLTGNKELDMYRNPKHRYVPLLCTFKNVLQSENIYRVVDEKVIGKIGPECLREFVMITLSCLFQQGIQRPSMDYVVRSLQFAVHLQETWEKSETRLHSGWECHITKSEARLALSWNYDFFENTSQTAANHAPRYGWTEGPLGPIFMQ